jgi:hypothetical protein
MKRWMIELASSVGFIDDEIERASRVLDRLAYDVPEGEVAPDEGSALHEIVLGPEFLGVEEEDPARSERLRVEGVVDLGQKVEAQVRRCVEHLSLRLGVEFGLVGHPQEHRARIRRDSLVERAEDDRLDDRRGDDRLAGTRGRRQPDGLALARAAAIAKFGRFEPTEQFCDRVGLEVFEREFHRVAPRSVSR